MTRRLNIPMGTDFKAIRESSCYYVDKTRIISGIIRQRVNNCLLFTRPIGQVEGPRLEAIMPSFLRVI